MRKVFKSPIHILKVFQKPVQLYCDNTAAE